MSGPQSSRVPAGKPSLSTWEITLPFSSWNLGTCTWLINTIHSGAGSLVFPIWALSEGTGWLCGSLGCGHSTWWCPPPPGRIANSYWVWQHMPAIPPLWEPEAGNHKFESSLSNLDLSQCSELGSMLHMGLLKIPSGDPQFPGCQQEAQPGAGQAWSRASFNPAPAPRTSCHLLGSINPTKQQLESRSACLTQATGCSFC